ncbi:MAG: hypothetical protein ACI9G1_003572, partial [Pirellulaceae bacterium]
MLERSVGANDGLQHKRRAYRGTFIKTTNLQMYKL